MSAATAAQLAIDGLLLGGIYAALGIGLNLIFGVMRVVNLAHGDLMMIGAYVTVTLFTAYQVSPFVSLPLAAALVFVLGWLMQAGCFARLPEDGSRELLSLLLAFGLSSVLQNAGIVIWGTQFRSVPVLSGTWFLGRFAFPEVRTITFGMAIALTAGLWLFLKKTELGLAIRAASQQVEGALVCGVNVRRVRSLTFAIGSALAGIVGALLVMMYAVYPQMGQDYVLRAFAIIVVGGLGSYPGAFLGGMLLGLSETFGGYLFGGNMASIVPFALLVMTLLVRPSGLLGVQRS